MHDTALTTLIEHNGWPEIPLKITTREGLILDATNDTWHLPYSMKAHTTLDFSTIINLGLRWVIKRYIQEKIQTTSTHAGYSAFMELDCMIIPGNPKGEAVRMEDPDSGPLHRSLELPLLIKAMREDKSQVLEHIQQKAAVALSIALGRNPANLTYLREADLTNLTPEVDEPCYTIKMPRIKKRQINPRDDFMEEYLDPEFANYIRELIAANQAIKTVAHTSQGIIEIDRPLFIKTDQNKAALAANLLNETLICLALKLASL